MKSFARLREHSWLPICLFILAAFFSVGCTSSRSKSGATSNPLAAYETVNVSQGSTGTVIGDGNTVTPGSLSGPVITVNEDGSTSINGHDNAPLLDNTHPGWQQSSCLSCHNETTNNPDHNYSDDSLCYLCHGTNGLAGLSDTTPPIITSVVVSPTENAVTISWKSDEDCVSRLVIKTAAGDKMEFPVSSNYTKSHKRTISGLQSATTYYYELICTDKSGNKTSTSSFSSVLMFQTNAVPATVTVPDSGDPSEEPAETEGETADSYFYDVYVDAIGGKNIRIRFKTKAEPRSTGFYYNIYESLADAKKKENQIVKDVIEAELDNNYSGTVALDRLKTDQTYYMRLFASIQNSTSSKWSSYYKFQLKN